MKTTLRAQGWCISDEGLAMLQEQLGPEATIDDIIATALDLDLRQIGGEPPSIKGNTELAGPLVLELLELRNVAMPSTHQVEKPRLFRVSFTAGGKRKFTGVEFMGPVDCITLMTPPGSKFMITKPIQIREQLLLLGPGMLKPLGGHVQEMVHAWRSGKQFVKRFRGKQTNDASGEQDAGPPPFVPFKIDTKKAINERRQPKDKKSSAPAPSKKGQRQESRKDNGRSKDKKKEREGATKDDGSTKKKDKDKDRSCKDKSTKKTLTGDEKAPNNEKQQSNVNKGNKRSSKKHELKKDDASQSPNPVQSKGGSGKPREKRSDKQGRKDKDSRKQGSSTEGSQSNKGNNDGDKSKEKKKPSRKPKDTAAINNENTNRSDARPKNEDNRKRGPPSTSTKQGQKKPDDSNNKTNRRRPNKKNNSSSKKDNDGGIENKKD